MTRFMCLVVCVAVLQFFILMPVLGSSSSLNDSPTIAQTSKPSTTTFLPLNRYLKNCSDKIRGECKKLLFDALFARKTGVDHDCIGAENFSQGISRQCCQDLVKMGKDCHEAYIKTITSLKRYEKYTKLVIQNGEENWNKCARESATPPLTLH